MRLRCVSSILSFSSDGSTTTFESLWMGVLVVTLAGERFAGRVAMAFLTHIGLPELIAADEDEYVALATGLAKDPDRLGALRRELRGRMRSSILFDAPAYARSVEDAYRALWKSYCTRRRLDATSE